MEVLFANDGRCVYCGERSQVMDHLIAFAKGGADHSGNLVPACTSCNQSKGAKPAPAWYMTKVLSERWAREGRPPHPGQMLRDHYAWAHAETQALLDRFDAVAAELADEARSAWFFVRTHSLRVGGGFFSPDILRTWLEPEVATAKAAGWTEPDTPLPRSREGRSS